MATSRAALELIVGLKDQASKGLGGIAGSVAKLAAGGVVMAGAKAAFDALGGAIGGSIDEAREGIAGMKRLQDTINSTGGAVGLTAGEIDKFSHSLSASNGLSKYSDDAIRSASTLLLRVNGLGKESFPQAAQAAVNLGEKFGGPEAAAQFLAKALDKPETASKALQAAGIALTLEQEKQITTFGKAGKQAEAQALILQAVNAQTSGIAQAAAQAQGPMLILQARFADMQEEIGQKLLPIVDQFTSFLASPAVMGAIQGVADLLVTGIGGAIDFLVGVFQTVQPYFDAFVAFLSQAASGGGPLTGLLAGLPEPLRVAVEYIGDLVTNFATFFSTISSGGDIFSAFTTLLSENFQAAITAAGTLIEWIGTEGLALLGGKLLEWGTAFVEWVGPMIPQALGALGRFLADVGAWFIGTAIPDLIRWLGQMGRELWAWIERDGPKAIDQLLLWGIQVQNWIQKDGLPRLIALLKDWGAALVNWIAKDAAPFIIDALLRFGMMIEGWVAGGGRDALVNNLVSWGKAFVDWIAKDALPFIGEALKGFADFVWTWITTDALPRFQTALQSVGSAFVDWVGKDAVPFIQAKLDEFGTKIGEWISAAAQSVMTQARTIGVNMVEGIKGGLDGAWQGLMNKFGELAAQLPEPMRQALGIHSPSEEGRTLGLAMPQGIALGVTEGQPLVTAALLLITNEILLWGTTLLANITATLAPLPATVQTSLDALVPPWAAFWATDNSAPLWAILFQGTGFWPRLIHDFQSKIETWYTNGMDQALRGQVLAKLIAFMEEMKADVSAAARDAGAAIGLALAEGLQAQVDAVQSAANALNSAARSAAGAGGGGGTGAPSGTTGGGPLRAAIIGGGAMPSAGGLGAFAGITTLVLNVRGGGGGVYNVDSIETEAGYRQRATRRGP